jgi:large subunit ribosomal protein L32
VGPTHRIKERELKVPVPKRKMSRSNTRNRRSQWKGKLPQINKTVVNGRTVFTVSHRVDEDGRYDGRQVTNP